METKALKKRRLVPENRVFNENWKLDYFVTQVKNKVICVLCLETVAALKEYNIKRHYQTKHLDHVKMSGQERADHFKTLEKKLKKQQSIFTAQTFSANIAVKASYAVSLILAKKMKPFTDGEMVKECLATVSDIAFPEKKDINSSISLSRFTIARRTDELASNIVQTLKLRIEQFEWCSVALDESCDVGDISQLAVLIRGIDSNYNITEDLLELVPMKGTTRGEDIYKELRSVFDSFNISLEKIVGICTDGARAMTSLNVGVAGLLLKDVQQLTGGEISIIHCIIHQHNLCSKVLNLDHVLKPVIQLINFLRARALNHRQFKEFLSENECEYGDVIYYSEVRWLSKGDMLKRVYDLKKEIISFLEIKSYPFPQIQDSIWLEDFAFLIDLTGHMNILNIELQGKLQFINEMRDKIKAFEAKLRLFRKQLASTNLAHFPYLKRESPKDLLRFVKIVDNLIEEFEKRFAIFRNDKKLLDLDIFASPFHVDAEKIDEELQIEIIELQNNSDLRNKFLENELHTFYQKYLSFQQFPKLSTHAKRVMSMFGSTYGCEQLFSIMNLIKNERRTRLGDARLKNCIRVAVSSITPNLDNIIETHQSQVSH